MMILLTTPQAFSNVYRRWMEERTSWQQLSASPSTSGSQPFADQQWRAYSIEGTLLGLVRNSVDGLKPVVWN